MYGDIEFLVSDEEKLVFTREYQDKKILVVANFSDQPIDFSIGDTELKVLDGHGFLSPQVVNAGSTLTLQVAAFQVAYFSMS